MKYLLAFLLHHANRAVHEIQCKDEFYKIKNKLLKKYGKHVNYDIQHIPGKKCYTCGGSGIYTGYYMMSGEKWTDTCNRCWRGWYQLPKWICLSRMKMGLYFFHQPLKREECARNPFTQDELGWQVSNRPVIEGYIEHKVTWLGRPSVLLLLFLYDRPTFNFVRKSMLWQIRLDWKWRWQDLKRRVYPIYRPKIVIWDLDDNNDPTPSF